MLMSTTFQICDKTIKEQRGVVFGEAIFGIDFIKDFGASIMNFLGGKVEGYEEELLKCRATAVNKMIERANKIGANALIGVKVDVETISMANDRGSMIIVTASATAVVV